LCGREVVTTYGRAVVKLCIRILEVLSESLGLEPHVIGERLNVHKMGLRTSFNYYPKCPQPELVFGVMPHSDSSIFTVLQQDMTPGLEVLKDGAWVPISPTKDALVINIGDQMQVCQTPESPSRNTLTKPRFI
jgi:isopenicillin N synthase-like dioxygenase